MAGGLTNKANGTAGRREDRNPKTQGVEARGRDRLARDLHSPSGTAAKTAAIPLVSVGQGDFAHDGNGALLGDAASRAIAAHNVTVNPPEAILENIRSVFFPPLSDRLMLAELAARRDILEQLRWGIDRLNRLSAGCGDSLFGQQAAAHLQRIIELDPDACHKCGGDTTKVTLDGDGEEVLGGIPRGQPGSVELVCDDEDCGQRRVLKSWGDSEV